MKLPKRWPWYLGGAAALLLLLRKRTDPALVPSITVDRIYKPNEFIRGVLAEAALRQGVPLNILTATAFVESRYNPSAGSGAGAVGLLQLMPKTAEALGVSNRLDALQSALGGAKFLSQLKRRFGNWETALAAYNWGPGNVESHLSPSEWPAATRTYVANILLAQHHV